MPEKTHLEKIHIEESVRVVDAEPRSFLQVPSNEQAHRRHIVADERFLLRAQRIHTAGPSELDARPSNHIPLHAHAPASPKSLFRK
jgi:hypothetical protein